MAENKDAKPTYWTIQFQGAELLSAVKPEPVS